MYNLNKRIISSILLIFLMTLTFFNIGQSNEIDAAEKEFRGVWVSTVWGIDYPSKATTDEETLRRDAIKILDNIEDMGFNAIFLQVRSCSDAIYKSEIYPWSKYLTGKQGVSPENNFDPLEFFIEEAHKRGIELHAWINPYRITASALDNDKLSANNPAVLNQELTVLHTDGKLYFNPGEPRARELIINGIKEILDNYDVDGIHLDDYFYPDKNFNDAKTYAEYGDNFTDVNEWRRNNNNLLIKEIYETVHSKNSDIKFGVSPAGIWANKTTSYLGSNTDGWGTYVNQFADSRYWVKQGYVDYIMPQIYWNIGYRIADYETLISWWSDVVKDTGVKLYIGQAAYRTVDAEPNSVWYGGTELKKQIDLNRTNSYIAGYCMFSYKSFLNNKGLYNTIKAANETENTIPNNDDEIIPIDKDYQYYFKNYKKNSDEVEDYIVMYYNNEGEKVVLPRSYYNGDEDDVTGLSSKTGNFGVMYNEPSFNDIENHPNEENIKYIAARNIILGYNGSFNPKQNIKRADFGLMLMRLLEIENLEGINGFDDTTVADYYYKELATAKKYGLIFGVGNNKFNPKSEITRQDIFVMTYRAMEALKMINVEVDDSIINKYSDKDKIANYAVEAISYFTQHDILAGNDGNINPVKIADRAEIADFLAKLLKSDVMMTTSSN